MAYQNSNQKPKPTRFDHKAAKSNELSDRLSEHGRRSSSRRSMRNLVRFEHRKAGLFYDGTPFRPRVPTVPSTNSELSPRVFPHGAPLSLAEGLCRNSEGPHRPGGGVTGAPARSPRVDRPCMTPGCKLMTRRGTLCDRCFSAQGQHECKDCGTLTPKRFPRCLPCSNEARVRYKALQAAR